MEETIAIVLQYFLMYMNWGCYESYDGWYSYNNFNNGYGSYNYKVGTIIGIKL